MAQAKTALVVSAHSADFVWRAGGAIALYAERGWRVKVVCLSFGERGESAKMWRQGGMTVDQVKTKLDRGEHFHIVDVREESEWAKDHLPGALYLGKGIIERDVEQQLPDTNAEIVLYCGGGFRSALVADNLQKMGYTNIISMDGGWRGWTTAGYPIERPGENATK